MTASLERLKTFARPVADAERCGLCATGVVASHAHLYDVERRTLVCACTACALLFADARGRHRPILPRAERLHGFVLDEPTWQSLAVPIGLCFFVRRGDEIVATYPSPGGATESIVSAETWRAVSAQNPALTVAEHTEALLVHRLDTPSYYLVSIDRAYALVGLVRRHWRGLGGGAEMQETLARFFAELGGAHA